jgi:hypothetical protein
VRHSFAVYLVRSWAHVLSMGRQPCPVLYTFRPEFPEETVERYPSLTLALGNNYPGLQTSIAADADANDTSLDNAKLDVPPSFDGTSSSIVTQSISTAHRPIPRIPPKNAPGHPSVVHDVSFGTAADVTPHNTLNDDGQDIFAPSATSTQHIRHFDSDDSDGTSSSPSCVI